MTVADVEPGEELTVDWSAATDTEEAQLDELVEEWIASKSSEHTRKGYRGDMKRWRAWCARNGVDVLRATKNDVEKWHLEAAASPTGRSGRPPAKASLARMVSAIASFYERLVDNDVIGAVPIRSSTRPRAPKHSTTVGLSPQETVRLRAKAREYGPLERAMIDVLVTVGVRVTELSGMSVGSYRWNKGVRTLVVIRKAFKEQELPIDASVQDAIDAWLKVRAKVAGHGGPPQEPDRTEPLFPNVAGGRFTQRSIMRMVIRIARAAGIESYARLSPHSLRHTAATNMLAAGVQIHVVQQLLGHENVATTERYDRDRGVFSRVVTAQDTVQAFLSQIGGGQEDAEPGSRL